MNAPDPYARHAAKVARIADQLAERTCTSPLTIHKRAVSHQVPKRVDNRYTDEHLDVSDLNEILEIDAARRICVAESGVTFVDLVAATLAHGLAPCIVPELKTITIGGAVAGCSIESASFRHGGFADTCLEYEVVTARGETLVARSDNENALLFQMMHGTFGTLGILTRLAFRLVPATPYVKMTYEHDLSLASYARSIKRHFDLRDVDFMDGILHSRDEYALSLGRFVEQAPYLNRYDWTKVYYRSTAERDEDYLRTSDYFFRYDHGVTNVRPKSAVGRLLFGRFLGSSQLLRLGERLHPLLRSQPRSVTLDVFIPYSRLEGFFAWWNERFAFYPLWCVPYRLPRHYEWLSPTFFEGVTDELYIDLAIYGMRTPDSQLSYREIEVALMALNGFKTLISYNYYSAEEFWSVWNKPNYDQIKSRTDPDCILRDLYEKTCRAARGL